MTNPNEASPPSFAHAFRFWLKLGFISFGGPTGQIAIMHAELVDKRRWISEARFLHALNYCMLLPGPEAQQLAIYIGWLLHRTAGGIAAGVLFVLPSVAILWALSWLYAVHGAVGWIAAIVYGLKPAVVAIVAAAAIRIGRKALKNAAMWSIAAAAFAALYFFRAPFPAVIGSAGLLGLLGGRLAPAWFAVIRGHTVNSAGAVIDDHHEAPAHVAASWGRAARILALHLILWWTPVLAAGLCLGWDHAVTREGLFFSKAALVTFGGAYAVLPYVAQLAVERYAWLAAPQMLAGLALAETTPGPLIMVLQFVGFMGGWNHPGDLPPLAAATLGALLTTWVTFVPCFLYIFLGAPHIERLRDRPLLHAALSAITAAVVGVILNLAIWFGWQVLIPGDAAVDWTALTIAAAGFAALAWRQWNMIGVIFLSGLAGYLLHS